MFPDILTKYFIFYNAIIGDLILLKIYKSVLQRIFYI